MSFVASSPAGGTVTGYFYIYEGTRLILAQGVGVPSGQRAKLVVPDGLLKEGRTYKFRAATHDGFTFGPDGWNRISPGYAPGKALDINGGFEPGMLLQIWDWNGLKHQRFGLLPTGDRSGHFTFQARSGAGALDDSCSGTFGTRVKTHDVLYNHCQQFFLQQAGASADGLYRLLGRATGLAMDVDAARTTNGAYVQMWGVNGAINQNFRIDPAGDNGLESQITFRTDFTAPGAPFLSSSNYPADGTWNGAAGTPASFTFRPSTNSSDLVGYEWNLDAAPVATNFVPNSGTATISVPMDKNGPRTLQVVAKDHAGNRSAVASYKFNVGRAGITQPAAGHHAVRRVRLSFDGDAAWTHVKYTYRRGEQALTENPVPLSHLTKADGSAMTSADGFLPAVDVKQLAVWDVGATLGFLGGPVQVRATMRDASGGTYQTPWVSFTLDRDASGAAGTGIGPGDVNLLTGDYVHGTTDAAEAGLSVSRTTSSRTPNSGLQLQAEQLTANQATVDTDAAGFVGSGTTVTRVADRGHAKAGALRVVPTNDASSTDTYAAVGGTSGLQTKLTAGRSYRVSGWVYVPAPTGLDPPGADNGLRIVVAAKGADGSWTYQRSEKAGYTDAWQQLSLDLTVPTGATDAVVRLYSGFAGGSGREVFFDDLSVRQLWAPFGSAWSTGVAADVAGTDYVRISLADPEVVQVDFSGGGKIWFSKGPNGWWPEFGAESLTLTQPEADVFQLAELDGTLTVFRRATAGVGDWLVESTSPPAEFATTRYTYETTPLGVTRMKRAVAPAQPGIDMGACATAGTPPRGCVVLEYDYAPPTTVKPSGLGDYPEQVRQVRMWTTDPATGTVSAEAVAQYAYDGQGRLREVWDPRISPALKTAYGYDDEGRVTSLTPVGELPWAFSYGKAGATVTGSGDWIDPNPGRLLQVSRASLVEGSLNEAGAVNRTSVVYAVPTTRGAGGPYDLGPDAIRAWNQSEAPTDGTAVFGPDSAPNLSTATADAPGRDGYGSATVHYLNAAGRTVNTATPKGPDVPVEGFIDTQQYDKWGNVVSSLEATNRLLALRKLTDAGAQLARLSLDTNTSSAQAAEALSTLTRYSSDGMDVLETVGPTQLLAIGNDPNSVQPVRDVTKNVYDEGKPEGLNYHLVTTQTEGVKRTDGTLADGTVTRNGYDVPLGCPVGSTSGWGVGGRGHGLPTTVTFDATGAKLTSTVCYDQQGRATESRRPGAASSDAGTTRTIYWTAGPNSDDVACGGRPEWAGFPCVTRNGGPVKDVDPARMGDNLPVKRILSYSRYGSAERVEESATGPMNGVATTQVRTTVTTYDKADRVISVRMDFAETGHTPVQGRTTTNVYDAASGDVVRMEATENGALVHAVTKQLDMLGRLVEYNDGNGVVTSTRYDDQGRPKRVTDDKLKTWTEFDYDRVKEPRGFVTSVKDSVAGTISAEYGPDGQLVRQKMPGSVTLAIGYDPAGVATSRTYTAPDGPDDDTLEDIIDASSIVENGAGQWVTHRTSATSEQYAYDALGRLTDVQEVVKAAAPVCNWRRYTWNDRAGRESMATSRAAGETCVDPAASTTTERTQYSYDSADRLKGSSGAQAGTYTYDPLGRITTAPVVSNPGAVVKNTYHSNDLIAAQQIDGVARVTWGVDALHRFTEFTSEAWVNGAWANAVSKVNHYDSDSDSPAWIAEDKTLDTAVTRFVDGLDGQLALETGKSGARVLQLVDLHGDVMSTLPLQDDVNTADLTGPRYKASDEFGNPTDLTTGGRVASTGAAPGKDGRYGWLGGAQRSSEALAGVVMMGVRLYDPATGRFWSTDSEPGGNATAYDYCSADPVNCTDLDGRWGFFKKLVKNVAKKVAKVAEVASNIPGPIGSLSAAVSAGAYAATGNKSKALEMGITAAAAMIPGGGAAVKAGFKMARAAGKTSAKAGRAGSACRVSNSFTPETPVLMADGTTVPISDIEVGNLVVARDPLTGETTAQPVLDVIVGQGDKHLIEVVTAPAPAGEREEGQVADVDPRADTWTATANHPIWVEEQGWTEADDLAVGDLLQGATGELRIVQDVEDHGWMHDQTVYNLSVASVHTYVVGAVGGRTLVHNCSDFIDPSTVRFTQQTISKNFSGGGSVLELANNLRTGAVRASDISPVRLVKKGGSLYSLDNRRLMAFQKAGVLMPYRMATRAERASATVQRTFKMGTRKPKWN
ncbi:hypothetical protein DQ244_10810 [Blastococcus sp. TBT05-19]|uniref:RICIN domain-containing protein n=1 Tax=Blastococcus sp. TBT05-19 TaxID=2250581 RepID=UPI000DE985B3|nr:RICIN domain-containing protein [Blastococcus sp. TBT05-19]RBY91769.1 hypothetical protein DQ244_10810 [Blastococcus sp. TBT05-19]